MKHLRKVQDQIFWDLLTVLKGGRQAFLIDYALIQAEQVAKLLQEVQECSHVSCGILSLLKATSLLILAVILPNSLNIRCYSLLGQHMPPGVQFS